MNDILSVLIWIQTVCKGYEQRIKIATRKEKETRIVRESDYSLAAVLCMQKMPEFLRILSDKVFLISILKGHNCLTDLQKMTANNPNVDLVCINSYIKFGQNLSIYSQDIEWKRNFEVNQGPLTRYK